MAFTPILSSISHAFFDDGDDPFNDEQGEYNPPFDPFGDDEMVLVQSPARTTHIPAAAFIPLGTAATDLVEQHALHAIFLAEDASEVAWDG